MRAEQPSRTAHFVALGRALADAGLSHVPDFRDPTARAFLSEKGTRSLAKAERGARLGKNGFGMRLSRNMAGMMALRSSAIDAALREAIAAGARQVVILGAGYDGRAWRMPELNSLRVFEVDHPATQQNKRARAANLPPANAIVTFVAINFENESLDEVLDRAGHDSAVPTCWIWEGVVMYLTQSAMRSTAAAISGRSAAQSTLIVNYHAESGRHFANLILRFIGEPHKSAWTPDEMAADLAAVGFGVLADTGLLDWNARFGQNGGTMERGSFMRIAVART
jgi:methyltransferase (TIGR00027 family)